VLGKAVARWVVLRRVVLLRVALGELVVWWGLVRVVGGGGQARLGAAGLAGAGGGVRGMSRRRIQGLMGMRIRTRWRGPSCSTS
jgi:hypothetical protein